VDVMTIRDILNDKQSPWSNPWVLLWIGLLVAFFIANSFMIYLSVSSAPRLVVKDYYERGKDYEMNVLKRQARDPGWKMRVKKPAFVDIGKPALFSFSVQDKQGTPVTPDTVIFHVYRPSDARMDFSLPMREIAPGQYQVEASFPVLGAWDILVSVTRGEDEYNTADWISAGVK